MCVMIIPGAAGAASASATAAGLSLGTSVATCPLGAARGLYAVPERLYQMNTGVEGSGTATLPVTRVYSTSVTGNDTVRSSSTHVYTKGYMNAVHRHIHAHTLLHAQPKPPISAGFRSTQIIFRLAIGNVSAFAETLEGPARW